MKKPSIRITVYTLLSEIKSETERLAILELYRALDIEEQERWRKLVPKLDLSTVIGAKELSERWNGGTTLIVLYENNTPIGFVECGHAVHEENVVWMSIAFLFVAAAYRGQGYGKTLFQYAVAHAKKNNVDELSLHVNANNPTAEAFYLKRKMRTITKSMSLKLK